MKHRHSFFIHPSEEASPDSFKLVNAKKGQPSVLNVRNFKGAREWKITINVEDLDADVNKFQLNADATEDEGIGERKFDCSDCKRH